MPKNIAVFASCTGSNAKKIIDHFKHHKKINVCLIVSNKREAKVLAMAKEEGVPTCVISKENFYDKKHILNLFNKYFVDYVVLAGFLLLMPKYLVKAYGMKMVNIHPSLLPKYGGKGMYGMNVHKAVKEAGEKESGMTVHYVNEQYDDGDIVFQKTCKLTEDDTPQMIAKKVQTLEHLYFPIIIENLVSNL